jgi:hypothetical protein
MATQWFLSYHITDENISIPYDKDKWQIVFLQHNAFYVDNFTLTYNNSDVLVEDVDYVFVLPYRAATRMIGKPMYGGLLVNRKYSYPFLKASYKPVDPDLDIDRSILINKLSGDMPFITLRAMDDLIEGIQDYPYHHGYPDYVNYDSKVDYISKLNELSASINTHSTASDTKIINKLNELTQLPQINSNRDYVKLAGDTMTGPLLLNYIPQNPNDAVNKSWIDNLANAYLSNVNNITPNLVTKASDILNNPLVLSRQPVDNTEIVTKKFIDDGVSNIGSGSSSGYNYPTGTLLRVSQDTNIPGYLTCNGAKASKTTYADLYAAIGDKFDPTQALGDDKPWTFQSDFNSYYIPDNITNFFSNNYSISVKNTIFTNVDNTVTYNSTTYYLSNIYLLAVTKNKAYITFTYSNPSNAFFSLYSYPYVLEFDNNGTILSSSNFISDTFNGSKIVYFSLYRWNNNFYITDIGTNNTPIPGYPNIYNDDDTDYDAYSNYYKVNIAANGAIDFSNPALVTIIPDNYYYDYRFLIPLNKYIFFSTYSSGNKCLAAMKYIDETHFNTVQVYDNTSNVFATIGNQGLYFFRMKDKLYSVGEATKKIYASTILSNGYITEPIDTGKSIDNNSSYYLLDFHCVSFNDKAYIFTYGYPGGSVLDGTYLVYELNFDIQGTLLDVTLRENFRLIPIIDSYRSDYPNTNTYISEIQIRNILIIKNKLYIFFYCFSRNNSNNSIAEYIPFILTYDVEGGLTDYINFSDLGTSNYHITQDLDESDKFYLPNYTVVNGIKTIIKT